MGSNGVEDPTIPPITTLVPSTGDPPFSFPSGSGGGCIADGPFSDASVNMGPKFNLSYNPRCLKRGLNQWGLEHWCNRTDLLDLYTYDDIGMFQFILQGDEAQQQLGVHGGGHRMVGGDMQDVFASPGDPVFYLHHAMIDRVWWLWQLQDPVKRTMPINGTSTLANNPPSPPMKLTDYINLGYVVPNEQRQLYTMMSTLAGGFCYVYL
jgi:tyrosinase